MKTVSDDLQVNIWEQAHMSKIVPSLLYNMQGLQYVFSHFLIGVAAFNFES